MKNEVYTSCGTNCIADTLSASSLDWRVISGLFTTTEASAIERGANAWDAGASEILRGAIWNFTRVSDGSAVAINGVPDVISEPQSHFNSINKADSQAYTAIYLGGAQGCGAWDDAVIVFNEGRNWDAVELPNRASGDSLECVAAHEFGHVLGLHHEDDVPALMSSLYIQLCDAGNKLRIGEDDYAALVNYHPGTSTGSNVNLSKFNTLFEDFGGAGRMLQEVWATSAVIPDPFTLYDLGRWRACRGDTWAVDELITPILLSTTSTSTLNGVDVEWRIAPPGDDCFGSSSVVMGTVELGLIVNAPASVVPSTNWTVPSTLATGNYKVCARVDPYGEITETSEYDNVVVSDRVFVVADAIEDPGLCP